jgi:hypothetical protein
MERIDPESECLESDSLGGFASGTRGLDFVEDLASPGTFLWDLSCNDAVMTLRAGDGLGVRAARYAAMPVGSERTCRAAAGPRGIAAHA